MNTFELVLEHPELNVEFPMRYTFNSYVDLEDALQKMEYNQEGFMLFSSNREDRVKIKNPQYQYVFDLKGNHTNFTYSLSAAKK